MISGSALTALVFSHSLYSEVGAFYTEKNSK